VSSFSLFGFLLNGPFQLVWDTSAKRLWR